MAEQAKDNIFAYSKAQDFKFTDSELLIARIFPTLNLQFIKSELANWALRKSLARPDYESPNGVQAYMMEQEYLRGGMETLSYLIAVHESTEEVLEQQIKEAALANQEIQKELNQNPDLLTP